MWKHTAAGEEVGGDTGGGELNIGGMHRDEGRCKFMDYPQGVWYK